MLTHPHRWVSFVTGQDFPGPCDCVCHATPVWLAAHPQFEILGPIVISASIAMVHVLAWKQIPSELGFHDEDVLENVAAVSRAARVPDPPHVNVTVPISMAGSVAFQFGFLGATTFIAAKHF
jgi:hypothetical protein